jgi:hypothetical protein
MFIQLVTWATILIEVGRVRGKRGHGDKLSNSGKLLKLTVPNFYLRCRKGSSGWTNYSGKVTSCKMSENEMDNRGSKSVIFNNIAVKEQRVDGSGCINLLMHSRCTLVNFERNSWARIPSKQFNILLRIGGAKNYSTFNTTTSINRRTHTSCPSSKRGGGRSGVPPRRMMERWSGRREFYLQPLTTARAKHVLLTNLQDAI